MEDGKGLLADGTRYLRESGEDFGPNGFWRRWTRLKGVSAAGKVCEENPTLHGSLCSLGRRGPCCVGCQNLCIL